MTDRMLPSVSYAPQEAIEALKSPDAIMETNIGDALNSWLNSDYGSTQSASDALCEGFEGYSQMCNLLMGCLRLMDDNTEKDPFDLKTAKMLEIEQHTGPVKKETSSPVTTTRRTRGRGRGGARGRKRGSQKKGEPPVEEVKEEPKPSPAQKGKRGGGRGGRRGGRTTKEEETKPILEEPILSPLSSPIPTGQKYPNPLKSPPIARTRLLSEQEDLRVSQKSVVVRKARKQITEDDESVEEETKEDLNTRKGSISEAVLAFFDGMTAARTNVEATMAGVILDHFDPNFADEMFYKGAIQWLPLLIEHQRWREVFISLLDKHPKCMMVNFVVKLIAASKHHEEVQNDEWTRQQYDIFSRVLATKFGRVLTTMTDGKMTYNYTNTLEDFLVFTMDSEHTAIFSQVLFKCLSEQLSGRKYAAVKTIEDEMQVFCDKPVEIEIIKLALLRSNFNINTSTVNAMLNMFEKGLNPADVETVYQDYISPHPPPLAIIRDCVFIDMLIEALFDIKAAKLEEEYRHMYAFLLSYATTTPDPNKDTGRQSEWRFELEPCRESIVQCISILENSEDVLRLIEDIRDFCQYPIIAAGVAFYAETLLEQECVKYGELPGYALSLIDQAATMHPQLRDNILAILRKLHVFLFQLEAPAEVAIERQKHVLDRFVHLLTTGMAIPVLDEVENIAAGFHKTNFDASLIRYFCCEVLDCVGPPYSQEFVLSMVRFVRDKDIFDQIELDKAPAVKEFIEIADQINKIIRT